MNHSSAPVARGLYNPQPLPVGLKEAGFDTHLLRFARFFQWRAMHTRASYTKDGRSLTALSGDAGYFDWTLMHPVHGVRFVELKVGYNKPSDAQVEWWRVARAAGLQAFVWWPKDWLTEVLPVLAGEEIARPRFQGPMP